MVDGRGYLVEVIDWRAQSVSTTGWAFRTMSHAVEHVQTLVTAAPLDARRTWRVWRREANGSAYPDVYDVVVGGGEAGR